MFIKDMNFKILPETILKIGLVLLYSLVIMRRILRRKDKVRRYI